MRCPRARPYLGLCAMLLLAAASSCSSGSLVNTEPLGATSSPNQSVPTSAEPFEAFTPSQATSKIKMLLTGLPASEAEVAQVGQDAGSIATLIDGWMQAPGFQKAMLTFFGNAFQQSQLAAVDTTDQDSSEYGASLKTVYDLKQIFPRTALAIVEEDADFTETVTGTRFQMNTAMKMYYAYIDTMQRDDNNVLTELMFTNNANMLDPSGYAIANGNPNFYWSVQTSTSYDFNQVVDSSNPNGPAFLKFYSPTPFALSGSTDPNGVAACNALGSPVKFGNNTALGFVRHCSTQMLFNTVVGASPYQNSSFLCNQPIVTMTINGNQLNCVTGNQPNRINFGDTNDWQWIRIRQPAPSEKTTPFYDLPRLRQATELVLHTPRIGFLTTPSFLAQWNTNSSNQSRVTANQALIVAAGRDFTASDQTMPTILTALDPVHAPEGSVCYGCHITMDPFRQFYRRNFSLKYHPQTKPAVQSIQGDFALNGVSQPGSTMGDLAQALTTHLDFATAWTKKVCLWANSAGCLDDDPEVARVAAVFAQSGYKFKTLLRELLSSPLVTYASATASATTAGQVVSVARRDTLCNALAQRLSLTDPCGIATDPNTSLQAAQSLAQTVLGAYPTDLYSRGEVEASPVTASTLSSRMALESLCGLVAVQAVPSTGTGPISASDPNAAVGELVGTLMGLTGEAASGASDVLTSHYATAKASGLSMADSIRSTFTLACLSPWVASVGF